VKGILYKVLDYRHELEVYLDYADSKIRNLYEFTAIVYFYHYTATYPGSELHRSSIIF